jgi:hypothetical protein
MSTEAHKEKKDKKRKTLEAGLEDVDMADATSKVCTIVVHELGCWGLTLAAEEEDKEGKGCHFHQY